MLNNPQALERALQGQYQQPMVQPMDPSMRGMPGQQGSSGGLIAALMGLVDSRGGMGQAARGKNVYGAGSPAPRVGKRSEVGGPQLTARDGMKEAIARRLQKSRTAGRPQKQLRGGM